MKAILANRIAPGLIDRYLASAGYTGQLTTETAPADAPNNLFHAVPGAYGAHGRLTRARGRKAREVFTSRHRNALWAGAAVVGLFFLHRLAKRVDV